MYTKVRPYKPEDHNFIIASFLRGVYYGNKFYSMVDKDIFMHNYKHVAESIIAMNNIEIACLPDDPDTIVGYIMYTRDRKTVHFVYIKKDWRAKFNIFKLLVPKGVESYSHFTTQGLEIIKKNYPNLTFNPFRLL